MSSFVVVFLFLFIVSNSAENITNTTNLPDTTTSSPQSSYYTTKPVTKCSSNHVTVQINKQEVILSSRVNFEPYYYDNRIENRNIFILASNSNPCNISTITNNTSIANKIVLIYMRNEYLHTCNPQQWTLNMQTLNAVAVLLINTIDMNNVYIISGSNNMNEKEIIIPTRMITQFSASIMTSMNISNVRITITCDSEAIYPEIICMRDTSKTGEYYLLDGQYQKQLATVTINKHPIWIKQKLLNVIDEYYIFLYIDNNN
eukprot:322612_1